MAQNQDHTKDNDPELERARKSMGNRMDPDPVPAPKEEDKKEEKPPENPAPKADPKPEEKKDVAPENPNPAPQPEDDKGNKNPPNRGERFIPMAKFHDMEREHKKEVEDLRKQITDLANQKPSDKKDDEIEAFMAKTGFDRETVEGLISLAEKRVLTPELKEAIKKAETIVKEAEIDTEFATEFSKDGEPALKTHFPNITADQLAKAKTFLDQISHTKEYSTTKLRHIIADQKAELEKLFGTDGGNPAPEVKDKKTIEPNRMGGGKPVGLTAKDFEGQKDFSSLNGMDPVARNELIKSFPDKTYDNYYQWVASQNTGLEVMRNGQRVTLK